MLGDAQLRSGNYVSAEASYMEALSIVERTAGSASGLLLAPLRGLGLTYAVAGKHELAVTYLDRALLISHRSRGLYDPSQLVLLRQLVASLTQASNYQEAQQRANYMLRVGERAFGKDDPRMVPVMGFVANWYGEAGDFTTARILYRDAIELVERKQGKASLTLVEPLRGLANTFTMEVAYTNAGGRPAREREQLEANGTIVEPKGVNPRYMDESGENALKRALRLLESNPDADLTDLLLTLLQLGDWFQIKHQPDKAIPYYKRAAATAPRIKDDPGADSVLKFPIRVYYPVPNLATRNRTLRDDQVDQRYVQVEFTVTASGDVIDPKVVEQDGTGRQAAETIEAIRAARFRPRFENGEPVATTGVLNRETFRMRKQTEQTKNSGG